MDSQTLTIEGLLERIIYSSNDRAYTVAVLRTTKKRVTIVGHFMTPKLGEHLRVQGQWVCHPKYGWQLQVDKWELIYPSGAKLIESYLGSGLIEGVGKKLAKRIVEHFGDKVLQILENQPELLLQVEGIGSKRLQQIQDSFQKHQQKRAVFLFLLGHGLSSLRATQIYNRYGNDSITVLTTNPYRLAYDIEGIGFVTADLIARKIGFPFDDPARIRAGLYFTLQEMASRGHCYMPQQELIAEAQRILGVKPEAIQQALESQLSNGRLVRQPHEPYPIYLSTMRKAEEELAAALLKLSRAPLSYRPFNISQALAKAAQHLRITLSDLQKQAIATVLSHKVTIITGGPGVGKTSLVQALVDLFLARNLKIMLAAPTGRAAKRLSQATGCQAKTIHRLLKYNPFEQSFEYCAQHPLQADVLIVDEISMLDLPLATHLFTALHTHASVVMVGDADQLPAVGPGNVLADLIESGVFPVVRLTQIFRQRQGSTIVEVAHQINRGELPCFSCWPHSDISFISQENPHQAADIIVSLAASSLPGMFPNIDPLQDIQVLSPMHKGEVGAERLNTLLAERLNPQGVPIPHVNLRIGDKVMQIKNNYDKDVFNGDIGVITGQNQEEETVAIRFDQRVVDYSYKDLDQIIRAYAVTIHKSQGSEYPFVILALHTQHYVMLERNLLYTAVTRGQRLVTIVGTMRALSIAIRTVRANRRYTGLTELLCTGVSTGAIVPAHDKPG